MKSEVIKMNGKLLATYRKKNKISQEKLAKELNVSRSTIAMWENNSNEPDNKTIVKIANILNVSTDTLLDNNHTQKGIKIPVLGTVAAGIPISAIQDILDYEEIFEDLANTGEFFGLIIKGDSMAPTITNGDIVIVRAQSTIDNGDIAIILVNGEEATCKKIKKTPEGVMLIPLNSEYEPTFYSNKQIEQLPVKIIGKVIEQRRKF